MKLFVVLGLGQFGRHTAIELYKGGGDVLAVDKNESRVEFIKDKVGQAMCADATDFNTLSALGADEIDTAVVTFGETELEESILACSALSDLGCGRIIVRASSKIHGKILLRVGATKVIYPEKQMGEQLAKTLLVSGILEQVTLSTGQAIANIKPKKKFHGKTIDDLVLSQKYKIAIIGIESPKHTIDDRGEVQENVSFHSLPSKDTIINPEDILIVVANNQDEIYSIANKD